MPGRTAMDRLATRAAAQLTGTYGRAAGGMLLAVAALTLLPGADGFAASARSRASGSRHQVTRMVTLLGSRTLGRGVVHQPANHAEAFSYTARSSGTAKSIGLYVQARSRRTRLHVAIYSNRRGRPRFRLTAGSATRLRRRAWNQIPVHGAHLIAGRRYWLVVLPKRGKVALRHRRTRACARADRRQPAMRNLPRRWKSRAVRKGCHMSAYVRGASHVAAPPTRGSGPTAPGSPAPPSPPSPPASQTKNCFATPSACGYPDSTNSGASAGTATVAKSGDQRISSPGTYTGWNVTNGSVEISASNVTIKDFVVTNSGDTSHDVLIDPGVSNVTIEDSTLRGAAANRALQYAVQNAAGSSVIGVRLNMYYCTECWSGPGVLKDSYANANGVIAGSHYEDIYYGGGGGALIVSHDTLYNPQSQTAVIFTKGDFGDITAVRITNNLLAGGGYTVYGGLSGSGNVVGPVSVTGNRFGRCLGSSKYDGYGYTCSGGSDSHGYYPHSGYYGVAADFRNAVTTWSGNYWDDNLAAVSER